MTFVNRSEELAELDRWWSGPGAAMGVVWGRRRVGKSMLLRHWVRDRRAVFHVSRNRPERDELRSLSDAVASMGMLPRRSLTDRPFHDWDDAFDVLAALSEHEPRGSTSSTTGNGWSPPASRSRTPPREC